MADPEDLVELNAKLRRQFSLGIRDLAKLKSNKRVVVLLLSWAFEYDGQMDTSKEIEDLRDVFQNIYKFTVIVEVLKGSGKPRHQINKIFANFLGEYDKDGTLLIIYYGGHGRGDSRDGGLTFCRDTNASEEYLNSTSISWQQFATQLEKIEADRMLIFDCCNAGILERVDPRPEEQSMYEFIGSTSAKDTAIGPSESSFTRALIVNLIKLAERCNGFSTYELLHAIKMYEPFRLTKQQPVSSEFSSHSSLKRLRIQPLPEAANGHVADLSLKSEQQNTFPCCLTLTYTFNQKPVDADITAFTKSIQELVVHDNVPITAVSWNKLTKRGLKDCVGLLLSEQLSTPTAGLSIQPSTTENATLDLTSTSSTDRLGMPEQVDFTNLPIQQCTIGELMDCTHRSATNGLATLVTNPWTAVGAASLALTMGVVWIRGMDVHRLGLRRRF